MVDTCHTVGHIHIRARLTKRGDWLAWGKASPLVTDCPVLEPGPVWFNYGPTEAEAVAATAKEIASDGCAQCH